MSRQPCTGLSERPWTVLVAVIASILFLAQITCAHSPSDMQLSYDPGSQQLTATITHEVPDPSFHYVKEVIVRVNDREIVTVPYSSQPAESSFRYSYPVKAAQGDSIAVSATCSLGGSIQRSITTDSGPAGSPAPGTATPAPTKASPSVWLFPAIIAIVLIIRHRKP